MVSLSLFTLIIGGTTTLLVMLLRMCSNLAAGTMASVDASLAINRVTQNIRQAQSFQLMATEGGVSTYAADPNNAANVAVTAVRVYTPRPAPVVNITINGAAKALPNAGTNQPALLDRTTPSATGVDTRPTLDFYRSDKNGNPLPSTGDCLWMTGTEDGQVIPTQAGKAPGRALVSHIAPVWNAVQFIQPYMPDGTTPIKNAVVVKITCSYYSRINGNASSDSGKGGVTQLTGECVYLRNHDPSGVSSGGAVGKRQY